MEEVYIAKYEDEIIGIGNNLEDLIKEINSNPNYPEWRENIVYYKTRAERNLKEGEFPFIVTEEDINNMIPYHGIFEYEDSMEIYDNGELINVIDYPQ